jgi:50S ribosomal subunit-associated GTPase HflX
MFKSFDRLPRALVLAGQTSDVRDDAFRRSLDELHQLARTLGIELCGTLTQKRACYT